jgi:hypothetical protein
VTFGRLIKRKANTAGLKVLKDILIERIPSLN